MTEKSKAHIQMAIGAAQVVGGYATALGYGVLSFVTGQHHRTNLSMQLGRNAVEDGMERIEDAKRVLARAK